MSVASGPATAPSLSSLPAPAQYETEFSYQEQWKAYKETYADNNTQSTTTVFDLDWFAADGDNGVWLVGCTSAGEICVWDPPSLDVLAAHDVMDDTGVSSLQSSQDTKRYPVFRERVSKGVLYSVQVVKSSGDRVLLVTGGDEGVLIFDWNKDILTRLQGRQTKKNKSPLQSIARFQPYPSATEAAIEINDVKVNASHVFGAAGDAFGCYKWDFESEKLLTTYRSPNHGYLHSVELVPNQAAAGSGGQSNLLLTGGEDGILGIWDCAKDQLVDKIDTAAVTDTTAAKRNGRTSKKQTARRISSILACDENWWTVAGASTAGRGDEKGFLTTFHAPTRSIMATVETREVPQQLAYCNNAVVSVANESVVSHWNPQSLERTHRVWCRSPSAYATAAAPDGTLAIGGVGTTVDLFEDGTQEAWHFSL